MLYSMCILHIIVSVLCVTYLTSSDPDFTLLYYTSETYLIIDRQTGFVELKQKQ